jgi:transcription elongation factor S-II
LALPAHVKICFDFLFSDVIFQVGKHLKSLTKHPRQKIRAFAIDLIEIWKGIIIKETSKNKNGASDSKVESTNGESAKAGKLQKSPSVKVEKGESVKVEKTNGNGTSKLSSGNVKVQKTDVKIEKTDRTSSMKVEKIAKEEKPVSVAKTNSSSAAAPPKLKTMIKSNDSARDKIRELLRDALSKVFEEADEDMMDEVNACDPIRVAVTVESVLFEKWGASNGAQKAKYRSLIFNLKDQNNPDFRRNVLLGVVEPQQLVNMSSAEMASKQRKQEIEKIEQKALFECERGQAPTATTDQFKCGRCGQRKTTYYQMQTRSADEPMTTYVTCVNCNNRWKFC